MLDFRRPTTQATPTVELLRRRLNDVEAKYAPTTLYVEGNADLLSPYRGRVSLVGSRTASAAGLRRARKLARLLTAEGIVIVSGLAEGIDSAAHLATMEAGGGTIAVIGTGIDLYYPARNRELQRRIAREHLLVSQFPPGSPPRKASFPQRNRTMALVSDATVIIEAGEKSGTQHQAWEAIRLARPLFILRSAIEQGLKWAEDMRQYGARILEDAEDVEELISLVPAPALSPAASAF